MRLCFHAGVTTEEQLLSPDNSIHPDCYMDSLAALLEAKQPAEAKDAWDIYNVVTRVPGKEAFRPLAEGGCAHVRQ